MSKWPRQQMQQTQEIADVFYTNNISQDDPYLLYATLRSGPKATFCSRDLMRSHAFLLGTGLKTIFQKWREQHQYKLVWATNSQEVVINVSLDILPAINGTDARLLTISESLSV